MRNHVIGAAVAMFTATSAFAGPAIIINEIDADQTGTDANEFVELYDGGVGGTDLSGLVVVLYNGSNDTSYNAIDLDGQVTNVDGYFVIGSATVPNVDIAAWATNGLQNGQDAVALYAADDTDFPGGTPVTATNLLDSLVYDTNDGDDAGLLAVLAGPQINEDGLGDKDTDSIGRLPNGTGAFTALDTPTPGSENGAGVAAVVLSVAKTGPALASTGAQITYTLTISNTGLDPAADVTIVDTLPAGVTFVSETSPMDVSLDDSMEPTIGWSVASVAGQSSFDIEIVVELPGTEGNITNIVDVATSSGVDDPGDNSDSADTSVTIPSELVINEVLADPFGGDPAGDANGDGTTNTSQDEFVELVNTSDSDMDLSNWQIHDAVALRHTFPKGTIVPAGCVIVVFGGGTPTGFPEEVITQTASEGFLGFNNGGDTVNILDDSLATETAYSYGGEGGDNQSLTRDPDLTGGEPLVKHSEVAASGGARQSPGTFVDGTAFCGPGGKDCFGDTDASGSVDVDDLVNVILDWGTDGSAHGGDIDGSGTVDVDDLVGVILDWGCTS